MYKYPPHNFDPARFLTIILLHSRLEACGIVGGHFPP